MSFASLLKDIDRIRRKQKKSVAQVAREIGLKSPEAGQSGYVQLYKWLTGRVTPKGENVMKLTRWRDQQNKGAKKHGSKESKSG